MIRLIKVWGVLSSSDKSPFRGMKQKIQKFNIKCPAYIIGREECKHAHYVGRASTSSNKVKAMASRWANHKSHFKKGHNFCAMTTHLLQFHRGEDPQKLVSIQILQSAPNVDTAIPLETMWTRKLFAFQPTGLNFREEEL